MAHENVEREIAALRAEVDRHNRRYYVDAAPEISDKEFDGLIKRLESLEAENPELITPESPTQRVGGTPLEGFASDDHPLNFARPLIDSENPNIPVEPLNAVIGHISCAAEDLHRTVRHPTHHL